MLQEFDPDYEYFLDRTTLLYGESGTGKSFIMIDILYQLKPHVDQIIVISPTDRSNHTYDRGVVPLPCIHYTITSKLLDDIWERQNAFAAVYTKANDRAILESLFNRLIKVGKCSEAVESIKAINARLNSFKRAMANDEDNKSKISKMESDCQKLIIKIWKHFITKYRSCLSQQDLSRDEQFTLKYLNFNPRLVIVFDDCTDLLMKFKSHPVIQKLFYQGRWAYITALFACHTDKALSPEIKKNAFISIFTEETCAHAYFDRKTNDLDKDAKSRASQACKFAFTPLAKHQKLVWAREEKKFFRWTATPRPNLQFGCPIIWEYCNAIKIEAGTMPSNNKFIGGFMDV